MAYTKKPKSKKTMPHKNYKQIGTKMNKYMPAKRKGNKGRKK